MVPDDPTTREKDGSAPCAQAFQEPSAAVNLYEGEPFLPALATDFEGATSQAETKDFPEPLARKLSALNHDLPTDRAWKESNRAKPDQTGSNFAQKAALIRQNAPILWKRFLAALIDATIMGIVGVFLMCGLTHVLANMAGQHDTVHQLDYLFTHLTVVQNLTFLSYLFIVAVTCRIMSVAGAVMLMLWNLFVYVDQPNIYSFILLLLANAAYSALLESSRRNATIGQRIFGLSVCAVDQDRATTLTLAPRYLLSGFSIAFAGLGILGAFVSERGQCFHDRVTGKIVVEGQMKDGTVQPLSAAQRARVSALSFVLTAILLSTIVYTLRNLPRPNLNYARQTPPANGRGARYIPLLRYTPIWNSLVDLEQSAIKEKDSDNRAMYCQRGTLNCMSVIEQMNNCESIPDTERCWLQWHEFLKILGADPNKRLVAAQEYETALNCAAACKPAYRPPSDLLDTMTREQKLLQDKGP